MALRRRSSHFGNLLRIRQRQEDLKAMALGEVRHRIFAHRQKGALIIEEQRRMLREAGRIARGGFEATQVQPYLGYERHLAHLAVENDAEIEALQQREKACLAELEEAMKQRRMVELLQERRDRAWRRELIREEQHHQDEVAGNQAAILRAARRTGKQP